MYHCRADGRPQRTFPDLTQKRYTFSLFQSSLERVKYQVVDVWSKIETADHKTGHSSQESPVTRLRRQWTSLAHTQRSECTRTSHHHSSVNHQGSSRVGVVHEWQTVRILHGMTASGSISGRRAFYENLCARSAQARSGRDVEVVESLKFSS